MFGNIVWTEYEKNANGLEIWIEQDGTFIKKQQRKDLNFKKVSGGMYYLKHNWSAWIQAHFEGLLYAKFSQAVKPQTVLLHTKNARLFHFLSRTKVPHGWENQQRIGVKINPQRWFALERVRARIRKELGRNESVGGEQDRFVFYSKSSDVLPGNGKHEQGIPSNYTDLSNIPNWRKVLSNFYRTENGITYTIPRFDRSVTINI